MFITEVLYDTPEQQDHLITSRVYCSNLNKLLIECT